MESEYPHQSPKAELVLLLPSPSLLCHKFYIATGLQVPPGQVDYCRKVVLAPIPLHMRLQVPMTHTPARLSLEHHATSVTNWPDCMKITFETNQIELHSFQKEDKTCHGWCIVRGIGPWDFHIIFHMVFGEKSMTVQYSTVQCGHICPYSPYWRLNKSESTSDFSLWPPRDPCGHPQSKDSSNLKDTVLCCTVLYCAPPLHYGRLGAVGILDHCNLISTNWLIKSYHILSISNTPW